MPPRNAMAAQQRAIKAAKKEIRSREASNSPTFGSPTGSSPGSPWAQEEATFATFATEIRQLEEEVAILIGDGSTNDGSHPSSPLTEALRAAEAQRRRAERAEASFAHLARQRQRGRHGRGRQPGCARLAADDERLQQARHRLLPA